VSTLLQDLNNQLAYQRLGGGRRFNQDAVTGYDAGGMFNQYVCEFCHAGISHKILLQISLVSFPKTRFLRGT
jgi:hypothetical protein